jgi:putative membrane protein
MPEPHALWLFALALAGVAVAAGVATVVTSLAR